VGRTNPPMKKDKTLLQKVKHLRRHARLPKHLNKYGPKDHELWEFILCYVVYIKHANNWRAAEKFMSEYYNISLHWTSWQRAIGKWPMWLLQRLAKASILDDKCHIAAIDGTGISRTNPSQHYIKRIDRKTPIARPMQGVFMVDVKSKKFLSWRIRAKPRGEKCDVPYLIKHSPVLPDGVLMDKGFDSNRLHAFLREKGVWSVAPVRKGCRRGRYRKEMRDYFDWGLYWQRNIVESMISAVKRLFGSHVRARTARMQRAEWSMKLITYNIVRRIIYDLLLSHK
jgi:hypothetical protein